MSIYLPRFQIDRLKRLGAAPSEGTPFAVYAKEANSFVLTAVDAPTEAMGLQAGLPLADARAIKPDLIALEADADADARLLDDIAAWCERFTPVVIIDPPQGLFLDITGCAHLFGGEDSLICQIELHLKNRGFAARAAIAPTPGAAWALARFSRSNRTGADTLKETLAPLPLAALRLAPQTTALLKRLGLTHIGQIADAPRQPLTARAGAGAVRCLDQALGLVGEALTPRRPPPRVYVQRRLVEPVIDLDAVLLVAEKLCADLCERLDQQAAGARTLQLVLFGVNGGARTIEIKLSAPARDLKIMVRLLRERLRAAPEILDAEFGFEAARIEAVETIAITPQAIDFDQHVLKSSDQTKAQLVDTLTARLGTRRVGTVILNDAHTPERANAWGPLNIESGRASPPADGVMRRPLHLFTHPQPIETLALMPDGPPARFRWRRVMHETARAEGPERIAPDWVNNETARTRDYYRVEDRNGRRFWIYREGLYDEAEAPRWFMHGLFS